ncbi:30S ribosomal protein S4 [Clostridium sp. MSJ-11]|uniref:Small ribosomal subunit protein uS4 n=1 Tax=Clostridium mobile TaxID=2841512 RepID=A0ABS6EHE8_9CLOT|nr:30S ribosomal protein S4 [Clostridium mobile]MBU5484639.1 30S ribosomal protein S4 [Clostridium mobile]
MARPMGPRFKIARRLGVNVFNHPKALKRGVKNQKLSEYGKQLQEKQKLKGYYGILEKQFRRYVHEALNTRENSGEILVQNLERRLDNLVYRLGFGSTLRQARQMVVHGHILVNGKKIDIPSYRVNIGDAITLMEKSRKNELFIENFQSTSLSIDYLEKDIENFSGKLVKKPSREAVPIDVIDSRIIEFYSKN